MAGSFPAEHAGRREGPAVAYRARGRIRGAGEPPSDFTAPTSCGGREGLSPRSTHAGWPRANKRGGGRPEPELDLLSNILKIFNEMFGNIEWKDKDKIGKVIAEELPAKVSADRAYQSAMKNSDKQNARIEHDKALERAVIELLSDHTELFKQFSDNPSFKKWVSETIFTAT